VNTHRHPYDEILIILSDNVEMTVNEESRIINKGNVVIVPAGSWHSFVNYAKEPALMVTIHSSPEIIQEDWKDE
jgi:mannose-6-phosphate isomerase-like protein (cupin superfamily)